MEEKNPANRTYVVEYYANGWFIDADLWSAKKSENSWGLEEMDKKLKKDQPYKKYLFEAGNDQEAEEKAAAYAIHILKLRMAIAWFNVGVSKPILERMKFYLKSLEEVQIQRRGIDFDQAKYSGMDKASEEQLEKKMTVAEAEKFRTIEGLV